jgi:hypothetical protein
MAQILLSPKLRVLLGPDLQPLRIAYLRCGALYVSTYIKELFSVCSNIRKSETPNKKIQLKLFGDNPV